MDVGAPAWCREGDHGTVITLRVTPSARTNSVVSTDGAVLRLKIAAPPVEDRANEELCRYLACALGVRASSVSVVRGGTSRDKVVLVRGLTASTVGTAFHRMTT